MRKPDRSASTAERHGRCEGANHGSPFRARLAAFSISASSPTTNDTKIPALRKAAQQKTSWLPTVCGMMHYGLLVPHQCCALVKVNVRLVPVTSMAVGDEAGSKGQAARSSVLLFPILCSYGLAET
jgi:hypothetical protein